MDIKDIKELILSIDNSTIETIEIEKGEFRIMISKGKSSGSNGTNSQNVVKYENPTEEERLKLDDDVFIIKSPMVGTFYASSNPEVDPFIKIGDRIEKGQTICIIEAMKIMNEIESEVSGQVVEIHVSNEDVVEYGQALMKVRRS